MGTYYNSRETKQPTIESVHLTASPIEKEQIKELIEAIKAQSIVVNVPSAVVDNVVNVPQPSIIFPENKIEINIPEIKIPEIKIEIPPSDIHTTAVFTFKPIHIYLAAIINAVILVGGYYVTRL